MKTLLFITPELPYPAQSGGKLKSLNLLKHLITQYRVTLACPLKEEDSDYLAEFMTEMNGSLEFCLTEPTCVPRTAVNLAKSYWHSIPINVLRTQSPMLKKKIEALPSRFDITLLDHYEVFQYIPSSHRGLVAYHGHNAYFKIWERYAKAAGNLLFKPVALAESYRVRRYEKKVCDRSDLIFAAPDDLKALINLGIESTKLRPTFHLGDDRQQDLPAMSWSKTEESLVYVGFLGWEANLTGLLWFIDNVWCLLEVKHPNLTLKIVGKNPGEKLISATKKYPNITLTGYVEDLETVYPKSRVSIAPLTFGSGMKVKVLSAMARGIPVVTTSIGAESIDVTHGQELMIADTPSDMANHISELLIDRTLWQLLSNSSRKLVAARYTWKTVFQSMDLALARASKNLSDKKLLKTQLA